MKYTPAPEVLARLDEAHVEEALRAFYVPRAESSLRPEEEKKIPQLAGILHVLARTRAAVDGHQKPSKSDRGPVS